MKMRKLVADLFTYLRDALGEVPTSFELCWSRDYDVDTLDAIEFSGFDETSAARLILLGGELRGEHVLKVRIFDALREIARFKGESVGYPKLGAEGNDEAGFDISVHRDGLKVTGTITVFDTAYTDSNWYEIDEELLALLAENKVTSFMAEYSGGGDNGERRYLTFETSEGPSKDPAVEAALDRFVDKVSGDVPVGWYNNKGSYGVIAWQAYSGTPREVESVFYFKEGVEVSEETEIVIELPDDFLTAPTTASAVGKNK